MICLQDDEELAEVVRTGRDIADQSAHFRDPINALCDAVESLQREVYRLRDERDETGK